MGIEPGLRSETQSALFASQSGHRKVLLVVVASPRPVVHAKTRGRKMKTTTTRSWQTGKHVGRTTWSVECERRTWTMIGMLKLSFARK
jgi:hypothetical protein